MLCFPLYKILNNSAALLTFLVLNLNGTKILMGFIGQHASFCQGQKLKLPSLVINSPVKLGHSKYFYVRCTRVTNLEPLAPQLEFLGAQGAPQNIYSGNQLWGLGGLAKMLGSPKGSLKFSLEHSLEYDTCFFFVNTLWMMFLHVIKN